MQINMVQQYYSFSDKIRDKFQICDFKQLKYFMINSFCNFQNSCLYTMYFYYFSYLLESRPLKTQDDWPTWKLSLSLSLKL